jgi:hypothetical protein
LVVGINVAFSLSHVKNEPVGSSSNTSIIPDVFAVTDRG